VLSQGALGRRGALLYNPAAGRRRAERLRDALLAVLAAGGWEIEAVATGAPGDATTIAGELARGGRVEAVFALGGDGTLREVATGLLGSEVALAPLPAGTTNVLARALGIPLRPLAAAQALAVARRRPLAVGLCGATPFLMMVSAGLDAAIMGALSGRAKARWGQGAVVAQGLASWWGYRFPPLVARWPGGEASGSFVAVCNIPLYAGPFAMAPTARADDDRLEVVLLRGGGRLTTLGFSADLVRGRHLRRGDVVSACVEEVELSGPPALPLQVDGDPCRESLPVRVRVASQRLQVLAPASD
jgi:diacylglycerol kinase family enzyme